MRNFFLRQLPIALAAIGSLPIAAQAQIRTPIRDISPTIAPPAGPSGLMAFATGPTSITVQWNAASSAKGYAVERRQTNSPTCCVQQSPVLTTTSWIDNTLLAGTQYTFRVGVMYIDGTTGVAEVTATTPPRTVPGPVPTDYSGTSIQNVVVIRWSPSIGAEGYNVLKDGVQISTGGACSPTCVVQQTGVYGETNSYIVQARFPAGSGMSTSQTPPFSVTIPHLLGVPAVVQQLPRGGRVDIQISNTANPDGTRGGLVSGTGNGLSVTDPGLNKLALQASGSAPLGPQRVQLNAATTSPAFIDAMVIRTPGAAGAALTGIAAFSPPGTSSTLRVEQSAGQRWNAIFNSMTPIEFERDGDFGGAAFCPFGDAVGVVLTSNGKRAGVTSPWAWILQDLKNPSSRHVIETQRFNSAGKGLIPIVYLTPDCTIATFVDITDNAAQPYRIRVYDLLTRQTIGTLGFSVPQMDYNIVQVSLNQGDPSSMMVLVKYPGSPGTFTSQTYSIENRSY